MARSSDNEDESPEKGSPEKPLEKVVSNRENSHSESASDLDLDEKLMAEFGPSDPNESQKVVNVSFKSNGGGLN